MTSLASKSWRPTLAILGLAAGFVLVLALAIRWAPEWLYSGSATKDPDKAADLGRIRTAVLASLAGLIAIIGAWISHGTLRLGRKAQVTERYTRAVEQLGNQDQEAVRLGGIYALEQIMRESDEWHAVVVELLSAYVRADTARQGRAGDERSARRHPAVRTDVTGALTVLSRNNRPDNRVIHLTGADLSGIVLPGTDLRSAVLIDADLSDADLRGCDLRRADLTHAVVVGATLRGANLSLTTLTFARFVDTDLTHAHLDPGALDSVIGPTKP